MQRALRLAMCAFVFVAGIASADEPSAAIAPQSSQSDLSAQFDADVARYEFRAVRPLFDITHFFVCGEPQQDGKAVRLWARDHEGFLAMDATAAVH